MKSVASGGGKSLKDKLAERNKKRVNDSRNRMVEDRRGAGGGASGGGGNEGGKKKNKKKGFQPKKEATTVMELDSQCVSFVRSPIFPNSPHPLSPCNALIQNTHAH